ncbi:hypothetical protein ACFL31_03355, partial [Candidatus Margulisiibacteriota bacterium]
MNIIKAASYPKRVLTAWKRVLSSRGPLSARQDPCNLRTRAKVGLFYAWDFVSVPYKPEKCRFQKARDRLMNPAGILSNHLPPADEMAAFSARQPNTPDTVMIDLDGTFELTRENFRLLEWLLTSGANLAVISHRDIKYIEREFLDQFTTSVRSQFFPQILLYEYGGVQKYKLTATSQIIAEPAYQPAAIGRAEHGTIVRTLQTAPGNHTFSNQLMPHQKQLFVTANTPSEASLLAQALQASNYEIVTLDNQIIISKFSKKTAAEDALISFGATTSVFLGDQFGLFGNDRSMSESEKITCVNVGQPVQLTAVLDSQVGTREWLTHIFLQRAAEALAFFGNLELTAQYLEEQFALLRGLDFEYVIDKSSGRFAGDENGVVARLFVSNPDNLPWNRRALYPEEEVLYVLPFIEAIVNNNLKPAYLLRGGSRFDFVLRKWLKLFGREDLSPVGIKIPRYRQNQSGDLATVLNSLLSPEERKADPSTQLGQPTSQSRETLINLAASRGLDERYQMFQELYSRSVQVIDLCSQPGGWKYRAEDELFSAEPGPLHDSLVLIKERIEARYQGKPITIDDFLPAAMSFVQAAPISDLIANPPKNENTQLLRLLLKGTKIQATFSAGQNVIGLDDAISGGATRLVFNALMSILVEQERSQYGVITDSAYIASAGRSQQKADIGATNFCAHIRPRRLSLQAPEDMPYVLGGLMDNSHFLSYQEVLRSKKLSPHHAALRQEFAETVRRLPRASFPLPPLLAELGM